jgi:hypothetical protein
MPPGWQAISVSRPTFGQKVVRYGRFTPAGRTIGKADPDKDVYQHENRE